MQSKVAITMPPKYFPTSHAFHQKKIALHISHCSALHWQSFPLRKKGFLIWYCTKKRFWISRVSHTFIMVSSLSNLKSISFPLKCFKSDFFRQNCVHICFVSWDKENTTFFAFDMKLMEFSTDGCKKKNLSILICYDMFEFLASQICLLRN